MGLLSWLSEEAALLHLKSLGVGWLAILDGFLVAEY